MKTPNFFILGAPKCGTTSLAGWLAAHPRVFIPPEKEPHHFNTDRTVLTRSRAAYERFYARAGEAHLAVGDASTGYLRSEAAVPNILDYAPESRFIVCLRNPVEMAISLHEQRYFEGREPIADFAEAWALQARRQRGEAVPRLSGNPRALIYSEVCAVGSQMARLYENVDRARVLPLILDDMQRDPGMVYRQTLAFLGVPADDRAEFPVLNSAKERRSPVLAKLVRLGALAKRRLRIERGLGLLTWIDGRNVKYRDRAPVLTAVERELTQYFTPEVERLSDLLDRDLRHWLRRHDEPAASA